MKSALTRFTVLLLALLVAAPTKAKLLIPLVGFSAIAPLPPDRSQCC
jgi:hypothetical protein